LDVKLKVSLLKLTVFVIFAVSIYFGAYTYLYELNTVEVDITSTVTNVIDGDTFDIATGDRIRLADVDCPERWEPGFHEATLTLTSMIGNKRIHLDVDDLYVYDPYSRLVCMVYVDHNQTHYLNVNKALLDLDLAYISNYDNEFNPYSWSLFVAKLDANTLHDIKLASGAIGLTSTIVLYLLFRKIRNLFYGIINRIRSASSPDVS